MRWFLARKSERGPFYHRGEEMSSSHEQSGPMSVMPNATRPSGASLPPPLGSRTFGIAGTPRGSVLLCQPLLRLIANFAGPLSDLTLGLTLPFKPLPWLFYDKRWYIPGGCEQGESVHIIPTLRQTRRTGITSNLRWHIHRESRLVGQELSYNGMQVYELWKVLACPGSFALGGNICGDWGIVSSEDKHYWPEDTPKEDPVYFLWAAGEGEAAYLLMKGEVDMKGAGKIVSPNTKDRHSLDLYLRGFLSHEETKLLPSEILRLCENDEKRHLAIPFLKRGDLPDDEDMSGYRAKQHDPYSPYDFILYGLEETFRFIVKHGSLDCRGLETSRFYEKCDFRGVVDDYILFRNSCDEWKRRDLRKCLMERDCFYEDACPACYHWDVLARISLRWRRRDKPSPSDLSFPRLHLALRILLDAYLFRMSTSIPLRQVRVGLMKYLGTGFMGGVKGRTGLEGKIDRVLRALSQGKKELFVARFQTLMNRSLGR